MLARRCSGGILGTEAGLVALASPLAEIRLEVVMARKKILTVDDSNMILMMEKMILKQGPYDLVTASDGAAAVETALAERPDLILLDIVMPKMDGIEACKQIRSHEATKETPIIMVTTRGESETENLAYEAGCTDYVTKPIDGPDLLSKMRKLLSE
jgi:DNA-binding response OmpR family regulator